MSEQWVGRATAVGHGTDWGLGGNCVANNGLDGQLTVVAHGQVVSLPPLANSPLAVTFAGSTPVVAFILASLKIDWPCLIGVEVEMVFIPGV